MICAGDSRSPHRRGNTYNPTVLRGPQPVPFLSLERGWTPPLPRQAPVALPSFVDSFGGEGSQIGDPPPYDDVSRDSNEPPPAGLPLPPGLSLPLDMLQEGIELPSSGSSRYWGQGSSIPVIGLETVVEEDEDEDAAIGSLPYSAPPPRGVSSTDLGTSGLDALPSYTASVHPSMSLASGPPIEDTPSSEQPSTAFHLAPIHLPPIYLAPITLSPISLGQAAVPEPDIPPELSDLSHIRANIVLLPEYSGQQVFTRDPAYRSFDIEHANLIQIPPRTQLRSRRIPSSRDKSPSRFQNPPVTMKESIKHFRDFAASITPTADQNIPALLDGHWDEDSSEGGSDTSEEESTACLEHMSQRMTEPTVSSTPTPRIMSMEERWGVEENSSESDESGSHHTTGGRRRRVTRRDDSMHGPDRCNSEDEEFYTRYYRSPRPPPLPPRTYLLHVPPSSDHTPSPDIKVDALPQDSPNQRVLCPAQVSPFRRPPALAPKQAPRGYFQSALEALGHHSWQPDQSDADWSKAGAWNCRSCGWLSPKASTECSRCLTTRVFETHRVDFSSIPQVYWHLPGTSAQEFIYQAAPGSRDSVVVEIRTGESTEQAHSPPESSVGPEGDEPQGRSKKKKKKKRGD